MKKALLALVLIISLLGAGWAGHYKGYGDAHVALESQVASAYAAMEVGTYHMAWTNVRACILAVDSAVMRFLSDPTPDAYKELGMRYAACEQHWELLYKYSPDDPDEYRNIDEARWMFDNWADQIAYILKLQVTLLTAVNAGRNDQAEHLYRSLLEERNESKKFRDHIERELFEAW